MEFVIISGLSGAGRSKAAAILEDLDFFCVNNLPAPLIPRLAELASAGQEKHDRIALVCDVRGGSDFHSLFQAMEELERKDCPCRILYMEAREDVIIRRYKESRRRHPLAERCESLSDCIALERDLLAPLRERAASVVDTSDLSAAKLKGELRRIFARAGERSGHMDVKVTSFGFKHGVPMEADLVFDVRFLPNPYYVPSLRPFTGLDAGVRDYVFSSPRTEEFLSRLGEFVSWLLPQYEEEGKTALIIAVGCTGGHHRSVAMAHALAELLRRQGFEVAESHRDLGRN